MDATAYESDDPFPSTTVGLLYNLKRGITGGPEDAEAEYDQIDTVYAIQRALEAEGIRVELMEADRDLFAKLRETRSTLRSILPRVSAEGDARDRYPPLWNCWAFPVRVRTRARYAWRWIRR